MKNNSLTIYRILELLLLAGILGFMIYWRLQVAQARFFDVDEFTHMHWAANMARGEKPYIDFFTFFTPGFYWILAPLFWIYQRTPAIFPAARLVLFGVFLGITALTSLLFAMLRSRRWALIPAVILVFLPMPYDKFLEIRPDNVAVLFGLAGVVCQIYGMLHREHKKIRIIWLASGFFYAASLVVLVKMLPFVALGIAVAAADAGMPVWLRTVIRTRRMVRPEFPGAYRMFVLGLIIPSAVFMVWVVSLGNFSAVWYALTRLAFEANTIGRVYIMEPHLFFFPNISFYGGWGITEALVVNHAIWFFGIIAGCYRFLTPYLTGEGKKERILSEILLSGVFMFSVVGYVMFFPLKHSQYLIPIAVFIAFYCSELLVILFSRAGRMFGKPAVIILLVLFVWIMWRDTTAVNARKLTMTNTVQLEQTSRLLALIPEDGTVLDLDGRLIFWRDPYYICCLPFGSFTRFLTRPPEAVSAVLEEKKVPFIFQGDSGRLWELWSDLPYINAHYERVSGWGDALWKRKD